jgi:hypothetical protein
LELERARNTDSAYPSNQQVDKSTDYNLLKDNLTSNSVISMSIHDVLINETYQSSLLNYVLIVKSFILRKKLTKINFKSLKRLNSIGQLFAWLTLNYKLYFDESR